MSKIQQPFTVTPVSVALRAPALVEIDSSLLHLVVGGFTAQGPVGGWSDSVQGPVGGW